MLFAFDTSCFFIKKNSQFRKRLADSGIWFNGLDSAKGKPSRAWRAQRRIYCLHDRQN